MLGACSVPEELDGGRSKAGRRCHLDAAALRLSLLHQPLDVLAARETVRQAREGVRGLATMLAELDAQRKLGVASRSDFNRIKVQHDAAVIGLADAETAYRKSKLTLGPLLCLPPAQAEGLELRGSIRGAFASPP